MTFTVVIPARFASTRLPGKPLIDLAGKPMIQRVYEQATQSNASRVVVATDHDDIVAAVTAFGGEVCLTRSDHESGTDRVQEVATLLGLSVTDIVVNVQGDEPLIPPAVINQVAHLLSTSGLPMATLSEPIDSLEDFHNPNIVKLLTDQSGRALYFSRAPIPWHRDHPDQLPESAQRHIGIYAYQVGLLNDFIEWPVGRLEQIEKLEQLRVMEQGRGIQVGQAIEQIPPGIDTASDLERTLAVLTGA